jgi:sulfate permease, SulP family
VGLPFPHRPAILESLQGYRGVHFLRDVTAGLVVGVVAIPLAIAFAIASGADPRAGLITAVVAGCVAALLGGSRVLVTGPTGAFVVILFAIAAEHGIGNLIVATFLAGILLVLAGWFRLGTLIKFIPYPVTTGFTAGIAVVILVGQLPDLLGLQLAGLPAAPVERAGVVLEHLAEWDPTVVAVAVGTVMTIGLFKRYAPRVPGPVVALVLWTGVVTAFTLAAPTVGDRFGALPRGMPSIEVPELGWAVVREMLPSAFIIALLGAVESLLAAVVADGMTGQRHDSNQELVGQGFANMASALFGGIAATGAIARTATNVQSGGRTPVAALVHAGVVALVLLALAPLAAYIPMAVLAGILVVVAWNMSERHRFMRLLKAPRADAGVLLTVFFLTVFIDLTIAVTVGMLLASFIFMHRMAQVTRVETVDPAAPGSGQAGRRHQVPEHVMLYNIDGPFFFGAADTFQETLSRVAEPPRVVVFRMRQVPYLDATGLNALEMAVAGLRRRGSQVYFAAVQPQPRQAMTRSGLLRDIGEAHVFRTTDAALEAARVAGGGAPPTLEQRA